MTEVTKTMFYLGKKPRSFFSTVETVTNFHFLPLSPFFLNHAGSQKRTLSLRVKHFVTQLHPQPHTNCKQWL